MRFISDSAHGWLEVDLALINRLAFIPSKFSYVDTERGLAYLEEDCDAPKFSQLLTDKPKVTYVNFDGLCFVRRLQRFQ